MTMINKPLAEIKAEFDAIDKTSYDTDWNWVWKNAHWEDFLNKGQITANNLRSIYDDELELANGNRTEADARYEEEFRGLNPVFHDWILKIFPKE